MLNDRARTLLKVLIERYIEDGQPVGSRALSRTAGMDLSAATIRNVMADLEELGFISSPHTSAGRIPTPRGYRFFVDSLMIIKPIETLTRIQLEEHLVPTDPQRLIAAASQMLSELTAFAGIVRTPKRRNEGFRHLEFLRLSEKRLLLILVTLEGDVQNRVIFTDKHFTQSDLTQAANYLNEHYSGNDFNQIRHVLRSDLQSLNSDIQVLMNTALEVGSAALKEGQNDYVLSGESKLIQSNDVTYNMNKLRQLFSVFEQKTELLQLLELSESADGVKIFIGGESSVVPLDEFSVVTAPYEVDGQVVGTLGVVGPTRMAYERIIPIVDVTAKLLSSALSQN
ncbi:MAG: heat-inducible transcriptional repressor HrcA [Ferrovum sp. 37-45-19]|uniref:heat-inducible transcriptional repressor HrcA n=1 Tax=Ferrovum sp. JA12 TaxID=1356299 RepID=UPI0007031C77|nr:heat-inducible transcriptional repressor HrcA [Ferrovum sp. JA12]OYV80228.1 MAG: heat-inducible transcriptional repressor HrcA [Ferrovum sp. 21-44-67]OYV94505.1 MAG: heat-inducible transcriptional repressor HrcA [Ferrovum sp. 37-45-19]OZB33875.1 MAG: heat-inducible transcriptional repressor HrcA [Ferrovum sp. 34-44-207]HQT81596.1 heat-inducible transcriptional repressor HrcA [Ferrovaceae bacterium]KRH78909.1 heat-inducible transcription repressor HrcA [Ferrovum sp. JA12]